MLSVKLSASKVKDYRAELLTQQGGRCLLCGDTIAAGEDVLDHDHKTGHVRGVLHRGCNAMLGHIENNRARNHLADGRLWRWLSNVEAYLKATHFDKPLHPKHRTAEQKLERTRKLAKASRQRRKLIDAS